MKNKMNVQNRTIFEGDNLHILRGLDSASIDLIYLDPPFNSNRNYSAPIGSKAGQLTISCLDPKAAQTTKKTYNSFAARATPPKETTRKPN